MSKEFETHAAHNATDKNEPEKRLESGVKGNPEPEGIREKGISSSRMPKRRTLHAIAEEATCMFGNYDSDFSETCSGYPEKLYYDIQEESLVCTVDISIDLDPGDELEPWEVETRELVSKNPNRFVELPVLDHGQWHDVFQQWLESAGMLGRYTTSIGLTLKCLAGYDIHSFDQEVYCQWKYKWEEFKWEYYRKLVIETLERELASHGIDESGIQDH